MMYLRFFIPLIVFGTFVTSCCPTSKVNDKVETLYKANRGEIDEYLNIVNNKSITINESNGSFLHEFIDDVNYDIVEYVYESNMSQTETDGAYKEIVFFEIPKGDFELNLKDKSLQNVKLHFGRYCYCKGQTGLFPIRNGVLVASRKKNKLKLELQFEQSYVPQITKEIKF
jgi:hypothetical protein